MAAIYQRQQQKWHLTQAGGLGTTSPRSEIERTIWYKSVKTKGNGQLLLVSLIKLLKLIWIVTSRTIGKETVVAPWEPPAISAVVNCNSLLWSTWSTHIHVHMVHMVHMVQTYKCPHGPNTYYIILHYETDDQRQDDAVPRYVVCVRTHSFWEGVLKFFDTKEQQNHFIIFF